MADHNRQARRRGRETKVMHGTLVLAAALATARGEVGEGPPQGSAPAQHAAAPPPAYVERGDAVEAPYRTYADRLRRAYEALSARVEREAPQLAAALRGPPPTPVRAGYQILPKLVADVPAPAAPPRATSAHYSWPWTEQLIERDTHELDGFEAELTRATSLGLAERTPAYEKLVPAYRRLADSQHTIDAHIHYNRLWQSAIATEKPAYDRLTALHAAVLERQAVQDALGASDDAAFRGTLAGIPGVDPAGPRDAIEIQLRERETRLSREIRAATGALGPPPFVRGEHPHAHVWVIRVPVYTDIDDRAFLHACRHAVESAWRVRDGEDSFRVRLAISRIPASRLYARPVPRQGDSIDVNAHAALFPAGGGVLTTGAALTHVAAGRCIALGPHDLAPHTLAHEFGHVLGFKDVYFRGYRDLGADGYEVMEVIADPDDIMGAPGFGPVRRHHFETLLGSAAPR